MSGAYPSIHWDGLDIEYEVYIPVTEEADDRTEVTILSVKVGTERLPSWLEEYVVEEKQGEIETAIEEVEE